MDRLELAVLVADRGAERVDPAVVPVAERDPEFHPERHVGIGAVMPGAASASQSSGWICFSRSRASARRLSVSPSMALDCSEHHKRSLVRIERPDAELGTLHGQLEPALDQLELLLGHLAVGDVEQDAVDRFGFAGLVVERRRAQPVDPSYLAVGPDDPVFDAERLVGEAVGIGLNSSSQSSGWTCFL